jgi:hypothetical protein
MIKRTWYLLRYAETSLVRFWFSFASLGWGLNMLLTTPEQLEAPSIVALMPMPWWGALFTIHAVLLMLGAMTRKYSFVLFVLEPSLGFALWTAISWGIWLDNGYMSLSTTGAMVAFHLFLRYPTHYRKRDGEVSYE